MRNVYLLHNDFFSLPSFLWDPFLVHNQEFLDTFEQLCAIKRGQSESLHALVQSIHV